MTKDELTALHQLATSSGRPMKALLRERGIAYSTYNYWRKKYAHEASAPTLAPITLTHSPSSLPGMGALSSGESQCLPGVTLAFPNGLRAHFGSGSERVLMEVLNQSLSDHVLPQ